MTSGRLRSRAADVSKNAEEDLGAGEYGDTPRDTLQWAVIGSSVIGASHVRAELPNQDALHWLPRSGQGPPLILAVSDGHGSPKSFRSDVGSRLAVGKTAWLIQDLLDGQPDPANLSAIKRTAEERLPVEIVRRWQSAVDAHLEEYPFTPEELERLVAARGERERESVLKHPRLAYGATIVAILVAQDFLLYLQLGDGDILTVMKDGQVLRPIRHDPRLFANETTSLCMDEAWREMRCRFEARYGALPALILAATDGYANSFVNDEAFLKVGSDLLEIARTQGIKTVEANLPTWLREASEAGSGDDITLGILYRRDVIPDEVPELEPAMDETSTVIGKIEDEAGSGVPPELPPLSSQDEPTLAAEAQRQASTETIASEMPERKRGEPSSALRPVDAIKHEGPREPTKKLSECSDEADV